MKAGALVAEGKTKTLTAAEESGLLVMEFRDDITAFDAQKHDLLDRKGEINNAFNAYVMERLASSGIATHLVRRLDKHHSLVRSLQMLPLECVIRNLSTGSLCRRLGVQEGLVFDPPMREFFLKNDDLGDPLVNREHMRVFGWATAEQADRMEEIALKVNDCLREMLSDKGIELVDFKLEFGVDEDNNLVLGDEVTPDSCRFWARDGRKLDKDRFRQGLGGVMEAYMEVAQTIGVSALDS